MKILLAARGFLPYLIIAFLNASVDLAHKITIQNTLLKSFEGDTQIVLTALINAMILLPFVLLFSPSGFISDKFSRTRVIRISAIAAIGICALIWACYALGLFWAAFALTILLAAQSAIYSPAKYAILKQIVGAENLGAANGVIQALTIVAILFSSFAFSFLFEGFYGGGTDAGEILRNVSFIGFALTAFSAAEAYFTFKLPYFEPDEQAKEAKFCMKRYLTLSYLRENFKELRENKNIWLSIAGLSIFWGVSQVIVAVFPAHYKAVFNNDNAIVVQAILAVSGLGLVAGSVVAGAMSKLHIEHGIVPIGALGISLSILFFGAASGVWTAAVCSFAFGFFGGLFIVPLNATIQYFAPFSSAGKILAGNNFAQNLAMIAFLFASIALVNLGVSTAGLFLLASIVCFAGSFYAILQLPHLFTRLILMPILKSNYKFYVTGLKNLPQSGGALLLGNHISWIDWLVLQVASPRAIKFVMYRGIYDKWYLTWALKFFRVIPIGAGASKDSIEAIKKHLNAGEVVALFPEGNISYNGQIAEFARGFELAIKDLQNVAVVPFYIRGLWGSSFSRASEYYKELTRAQGKREIIVAFGEPIFDFIDASALRQKVVELSYSSWENFIGALEPLQNRWLDNAKANLGKICCTDATGAKFSNLKFIAAVLTLSKILEKTLKNEKNVGVLLPSSAGAAIVNMALFAIGKTPVNLNYTLNEASMGAALNKAQMGAVVTARKFLDKLCAKGFSFENLLENKAVFTDDLKEKVSARSKISALLCAAILPAPLVRKFYFKRVSLDDTAAILFSSGSEGEPKGIELTHKNLLTNIKQISELLNFRKDDVILNSLPIFHSFGLTVATLMPLAEGIRQAIAPDPTDGAAIGKLAARQNATIMFGTSTFFRLYIKNPKFHPLMLQSMRMVIAGAEKLKSDVKEAFKMKFGLEIYEGYGATETTPVACVNMPNVLERESLKELTFNKPGSVGLPLPGTIVKIVDPATLEELKTGEDGLIIIGGGQVMKGYLNDEAKTAEAICEIAGVRYYKTGDKGHIDEQGFVTIVDRYSRFAKIGGEMISLTSVEEQISKVLGEASLVAANVPDDKKGEAVALLVKSQMSEEEILEAIKAANLAPIMLPSFIFCVEEIPTLASGKVDFKAAKAKAAELAGAKI